MSSKMQQSDSFANYNATQQIPLPPVGALLSVHVPVPSANAVATPIVQDVQQMDNGNGVGLPPTNDAPVMRSEVVNRKRHLVCRWNDCGEKLSTPNTLAKHINAKHMQCPDERSGMWRCQWVGCTENPTFSNLHLLRCHLCRHTGQVLKKCHYPGCGKEYVQTAYFKKHLRNHIGEKPYKCGISDCPMAFCDKSQLHKHRARMHSNEKPFRCPSFGCTSAYAEGSSLRLHMNKVHGVDEYKKAKKVLPVDFFTRRRNVDQTSVVPSTLDNQPLSNSQTEEGDKEDAEQLLKWFLSNQPTTTSSTTSDDATADDIQEQKIIKHLREMESSEIGDQAQELQVDMQPCADMLLHWIFNPTAWSSFDMCPIVPMTTTEHQTTSCDHPQTLCDNE